MVKNLNILRAQKTQMEDLEDTKAFYTVEGVEEAHLLNTDGNYQSARSNLNLSIANSTRVTKNIKEFPLLWIGSVLYHFSGSRSVFIFN